MPFIRGRLRGRPGSRRRCDGEGEAGGRSHASSSPRRPRQSVAHASPRFPSLPARPPMTTVVFPNRPISRPACHALSLPRTRNSSPLLLSIPLPIRTGGWSGPLDVELSKSVTRRPFFIVGRLHKPFAGTTFLYDATLETASGEGLALAGPGSRPITGRDRVGRCFARDRHSFGQPLCTTARLGPAEGSLVKATSMGVVY